MQEQKVRFVTKKLGGLAAEKGSNLLSSPCVEPPAVVQSCAAKAILASVSDGGDSLSSEPSSGTSLWQVNATRGGKVQ